VCSGNSPTALFLNLAYYSVAGNHCAGQEKEGGETGFSGRKGEGRGEAGQPPVLSSATALFLTCVATTDGRLSWKKERKEKGEAPCFFSLITSPSAKFCGLEGEEKKGEPERKEKREEEEKKRYKACGTK